MQKRRVLAATLVFLTGCTNEAIHNSQSDLGERTSQVAERGSNRSQESREQIERYKRSQKLVDEIFNGDSDFNAYSGYDQADLVDVMSRAQVVETIQKYDLQISGEMNPFLVDALIRNLHPEDIKDLFDLGVITIDNDFSAKAISGAVNDHVLTSQELRALIESGQISFDERITETWQGCAPVQHIADTLNADDLFGLIKSGHIRLSNTHGAYNTILTESLKPRQLNDLISSGLFKPKVTNGSRLCM
jgi:hypothetical protein